jgi:hypothetical protein
MEAEAVKRERASGEEERRERSSMYAPILQEGIGVREQTKKLKTKMKSKQGRVERC